MDGPVMAGFKAALEPINALADAAPGFVWRLQTEDGDATAIRPYEDERMMVNMSVVGVDRGAARVRLHERPHRGDAPPQAVVREARHVSRAVVGAGRATSRPSTRRRSGSST